jgi:hypothetical protein
VKQNRTPALLFHQPELARQAAGQLSRDPRIKSRDRSNLGHHHQTGLTVRCELDTGQYPSGIVVSDHEMAAINIKRAQFHGVWNYTISPKAYPPDCAFIS